MQGKTLLALQLLLLVAICHATSTDFEKKKPSNEVVSEKTVKVAKTKSHPLTDLAMIKKRDHHSSKARDHHQADAKQLNLQQVSSTSVEKIRIVRNYINHVTIQCPVNSNLIRTEHIKFIDERYDFNKADSDVLVTSQNLIASSHATLQLFDGLTYFSCGYILNNCYVRVKLWQIDYVEHPSVFLKIDYNPAVVNFGSINDTYGQMTVLSNPNPLDWNKQLDMLRLKCVNNFDYPVNTKYIWMYSQNPAYGICETWHKYDIEPLAQPHENLFQTFYNPDQNRNCPLSDFLKNLCDDPNYHLTFQCASYFEKANSHEKVFLLADSKNFTLDCNCQAPPLPTLPTFTLPPFTLPPVAVPQTGVNVGAIIGAVLGGLLALLLLLCLLGLCIYLCLRRRRRRPAAVAKPQPVAVETTSSHSVVYPAAVTTSQVQVDKASQFTNQIECSNIDTQSCCNGATIHHTCAPETYLRMITIQKDCCDDNVSSSNEMMTQQQTNQNYTDCSHRCSQQQTTQQGSTSMRCVNGLQDDNEICATVCAEKRQRDASAGRQQDYYVHNYQQHQTESVNGHFV